jgi:hypothetical protein
MLSVFRHLSVWRVNALYSHYVLCTVYSTSVLQQMGTTSRQSLLQLVERCDDAW